MSLLARLPPIVLLCAVGAIQAAPAAGKVGEDAPHTVVSIFPWDPSSSFSIRLPIPFLALGTVAEASSSFSTVLAITLPPPSPETTNTNGTWIPSTSTVVVDETIVVTSTTTAEASTVTVPLFFPPETVVNTVIITLSPSPLISTTTATATSTVVVTPSSSPPSPPPSHIPTRSSPSRAAPTPSPSPSASGHLPNLDGLVVWTAPTQLKNLDSFNITSFPGSQKNLKIVKGMPGLASVSSNQRISAAKVAIDSEDEDEDARQHSLSPITSWTPSSSSLQLFYPAGSINPAQKPQGGAEFYASPLDISTARNVSFRFSVFFPVNFDWVLAGKLPGIYGGHTGCSGGNKALDCFSTRLMWRKGGLGELYLYAAKDKQTKALCADPRSVCDAAYGFSIGRGSFTWAAGAWTTVVQTVVLNTPGKQDGFFKLEVNGRTVIDRSDVFYRDLLWPSSGKASSTAKSTKRPTTTAVASTTAPPHSTTTRTTIDDPLGDILGPLLSEITHLIRRGGKTQTAGGLSLPPSSTLSPLSAAGTLPTSSYSLSQTLWDAVPTATSSSPTVVSHVTSHFGRLTGVEAPQSTPLQSVLVGVGASPNPTPTPTPGFASEIVGRSENADDDNEEDSDGVDDLEGQLGLEGGMDDGSFSIQATPQREGDSIGFIGLFFSTFFGGHDEKYATPRDQYVWFKDFAISCNE